MPQALVEFRFAPEPGVETLVSIGAGLKRSLGERLESISPGRWFTITSEAVISTLGPAWGGGPCPALLDPDPILVPDGERAKTWNVLGRVLLELKTRGIRRDGGIVAFGGGTVGDLAGLAASLTMRGIPVVQEPTTLLAASDSALGGKTAVDHGSSKNFAGTFHHPSLVLVDTESFQTLTERDYRSGLSEIIKSALLDWTFFDRFGALAEGLANRAPDAMAEAVHRSLQMKASYVKRDPRETRGIRFALNLGHTAGHALETASRFRLRHGEAVAWGMLVALSLSRERAQLSEDTAEKASDWIRTLVKPPRLTPSILKGWMSFLAFDKKADQTGLRAVLLEEPGRVVVDRFPEHIWQDALTGVLSRYNPG